MQNYALCIKPRRQIFVILFFLLDLCRAKQKEYVELYITFTDKISLIVGGDSSGYNDSLISFLHLPCGFA